MNEKPEPHIFAEPLHIVGTPAVIEQAEMEPIAEVRLISGEADGYPLVERYDGCVEGLDAKITFGALVVEATEYGVHGTIAAVDDVEWRNGTAGFFEKPAARLGNGGLKGKP